MADDRDELWRLLSEGWICVCARSMDSMDRRRDALAVSSDPDAWQASGAFGRYVEGHNANRPESPIHTKSATVYLWMQEQYDKDLADWETRTKGDLVKNPSLSPSPSR